MKKVLAILLTIALLLSFGLFALGSGSDDTDTPVQNDTADQAETPAAEKQTEAPTEEPTEAPTEDDTTLGDYKVEIKSFRLASDYEGDPVIIITYGFTNVSDDDAAAFMYSIEDTVYQNGVGLNSAIVMDDNVNYSSDNQTKELKMGASLDVEVAYELNDTTSDVEVEVKEWLSFNEKVLTKTFSIA